MHTVARVIPGSPAFRAGVKPGDVLCAVNGHTIADILDYRYHTAAFFCAKGRDRTPVSSSAAS
jgi:S1-C subfamily serine protease